MTEPRIDPMDNGNLATTYGLDGRIVPQAVLVLYMAMGIYINEVADVLDFFRCYTPQGRVRTVTPSCQLNFVS